MQSHVTDSKTRRDRQGRQQMSRIEQTDVELVAHVRPGHFADQFDVEPFGRGETRIAGDQHSWRVHQRNETDPKLFVHLSSSAAVSTDWAISTIFLFSFMALVRSSA